MRLKNPQSSYDSFLGATIVVVSIVTMAATVRFWMDGFAGFIAYGAVRSVGGVFFAKSFHVSTQYVVIFSIFLFTMAFLSYRFTAKRFVLRPVDRASIVIAAVCLLASLLFGNTYRSLAIFAVGDFALFLSWLADERRKAHRRAHTAPAVNA